MPSFFYRHTELNLWNVYEGFYRDKTFFGFSDYPRDSKIFNPANKNVIGKMKDEFKGKIICEFAWLKSKIYSLVDVDGKDNKKGVNKSIVRGIRQK